MQETDTYTGVKTLSASTMREKTEASVPLLLICLQCGKTLEPKKCKLVCDCGYFMSCSDYY